jgi:hypothetical protein
MGATPEELKERIEQTRSELSADVDSVADRLSPTSIARRRANAVRDSAGQVRTKVMGGASTAAGAAGSAPGALTDRAQGNPLAGGIIAFGLGLLAASLVPTSPVEEEVGAAIKEAGGEPLKQVAQEQADAAKESLLPAAQDAVQKVKESASDAAAATAQHAKEGAGTATQDAKQAAGAVREAGGGQ